MSTSISYAQNFEDVMLWRALKHVENGFYIDLGAQDPVVDSISLAFHERGWKGIHVEPTPRYAQMLREQRPGDMVVEAAVTDTPDLLTLFEIPGTGISTGDPKIAEQHRERGYQTREITVPCVPLSSVFKACGKQVIHWMKVDVEGMEWSALASWGNATARPWIVVVESTLPLTQVESHERWEPLLLKRGYTPVYFDGLNRYYVSKEKDDLTQAFHAPPNVFDKFSISGTASNDLHLHLNARNAAELAAIDARLHRASSEVEGLKQTLSARDVDHSKLMQEHLAELDARKEELLRLERERAQREESFGAQSREHSQQMAALLRQLAAFERDTASKLLDWQQKANDEREQLTQRHSERERELVRDLRSLEADITRLAREHADQLAQLQLQREQLSQRHSERERELVRDLRSLEADVTLLAKAHADQLAQSQRRLAERELELFSAHEAATSSLKQVLLAREREFSERMLAFQDQALELQRRLQAEANDHILQLSQAHADELLLLRQDSNEREKHLQEQLESVQRSAENLREQAQAQSDNHHRELAELAQQAKIAEDSSRVRAHALQSQIDSLRSTRLGLQQTVHQLRLHVNAMHSSLSWRLTSPARRVAAFFFPSQATGTEACLVAPSSQDELSGHALQVSLLPEPVLVSSEDIMQPTSNQVLPSFASSGFAVQGLMASDDQEFVQLAYRLVFGRNADPAGGEHYLGQLRKGSSRLHILSQLRLSPEGIAHAAKNPQLDEDLAVATNAKAVTTTFEELVAFQGLGFVRAAYLTMLGREPDPAGLKDCIAHLRKGAAKVEILMRIRNSAEWQMRTTSIQGIVEAARLYRTSRNASPESLTAQPEMRAGQPVGVTPTINDLLKGDEQEFLRGAFALLLGRAPDPEAFGTYLHHLGTGVPRLQLLEAIESSPEARNRAAFVASIERAIRQYRIATAPVVGPFARILMQDVEKADDMSRALRAIQFDQALSAARLEHQLATIEKGGSTKDGFAQRFEQIQEGIATLQRLTIEQSQQIMNAAQHGMRGNAAGSDVSEVSDVAAAQIPEPRNAEPEGLSNLPARARDIYAELKAATMRHSAVVG